MSAASAKAYVQRMKTDQTFAMRVNACKEEMSRNELLKNEGFEFTADELKYLGLAPEELAAVVGGLTPIQIPLKPQK